MSDIRVVNIRTTIEINQNSAQLLVDALLSYANSLTKDNDGCQCGYCENPNNRARKILDIYFEAYPLSKVAKHVIVIPSLKDIESRLEQSTKPSTEKESN